MKNLIGKRLKVCDRLSFQNDKWYMDEDGNMRVPVIIFTAGVLKYEYADTDGESVIVREAKLPEQVLAKHVLFSAEGKPVTDEHPPAMLDSSNYQQYSKGVFINPKVVDDSLHGEIVVYDSELQQEIKDGVKYQISPGFWSSTEFKSGEFNGQQYDAIQKDIYVNHIAIVKDGRAGDDVRIKLDSADITMVKNKINGVTMPDNSKKDTTVEDKIDEYEEGREQSETPRTDIEETKVNDQEGGEDEDNTDTEMKDPNELDESKEDQELPPEVMEMINELKTENAMLKERLTSQDSKMIDAQYMEARDFAIKHVTDTSLDQYNDSADYYRKAVIDADGYDSKKFVNKGELKGAFAVAKTVLQSNNTISPVQEKNDTAYRTELEKAQAESDIVGNNFQGRRTLEEVK